MGSMENVRKPRGSFSIVKKLPLVMCMRTQWGITYIIAAEHESHKYVGKE